MSQRLCSPAGVLLLAAQFALVAAGASNARSASFAFEQATAQTSPALDALWQEARRQFGAFRYEAAIEALDRLIGALTASAATQQPDSLVHGWNALTPKTRQALKPTSSAWSSCARTSRPPQGSRRASSRCSHRSSPAWSGRCCWR
jgi:hypothetical protein